MYSHHFTQSIQNNEKEQIYKGSKTLKTLGKNKNKNHTLKHKVEKRKTTKKRENGGKLQLTELCCI